MKSTVCTPATWVTRGAQVCGRAYTHTFRWGTWLWFGVWIDSADFLTLTGLGGADASWFHYRSGGKRNASVIRHATVFVRCRSREQKSKFLVSWKCLPHRSFCIVGEPTLPFLISFFLSWFRKMCSRTILRKSAKKPLSQSQSGAPSSREVINAAVLRLQRLGNRGWTTSKHALCSRLPLSRLESRTIQACRYPPSSCVPTPSFPLLL